MAFSYIWKYTVNSNFITEFEKEYGSQGLWVNLFKQYEGYRSTNLMKLNDSGNIYLTIDTWESYEDYKRFKQTSITEFDTIDMQCEKYTDDEVLIGEFTHLN